jgi:hypothetical protein
MSIPTEGDEYAKLMEYLRKAQETCATLSHLTGLNDKRIVSKGWLAIAEQMRKTQHVVTQIARGKMQ